MSTFSNMPLVLTAAQMREADRFTIQEIGIPGFTLMESAGREVAFVAEEMLDSGLLSSQDEDRAHIIILCGKGNNGGDGYVAARYLSGSHRVSVVMMARPDELTTDASAHFQVWTQAMATEPQHNPADRTVMTYESVQTVKDLPQADLIVDALLGTGLNSDVRGPFSDLIQWVNGHLSPVLSVDIPSGLCSDSGAVLGVAVKAQVTVTLAAPKVGLLLGEGPDCVGALHVADIGIPTRALLAATGIQPQFLSTDREVRVQLPQSTRHDHKYTTGPTLVAGGSASFPGAPVLASLGAARVGSKYVVCIGPREIHPLLSEKLTEIPVDSWETDASEEQLDALIDRLGTRWSKAKSLLIGPGLGRGAEVKKLVMHLLSRFSGPVVVDADALFALQGEQEWVRSLSMGSWIFTPHEGEFARLIEGSQHHLDRLAQARKLASEWNVIVLLKGLPTLCVFPSGEAVINSTGNPAAGTAGAGDVLAGIIAGLLGQGLAPQWASICGIHVAGTATDLYVEEQSGRSMMASDVLTYLPHALSALSS